jgi:poly-gamma-glutamate synthesis protein (capsule biosynthesis protein)
MLGHLDEKGIARAGAGRNLVEAARPALLPAGGIRVGVLSFTDNEPGWAASATSPGINYLPVTLAEQHFGRVREGIAAARAAGADLVIFENHWGPNMRLRPPPAFRDFAEAVIDAGADIFVGHSAHVLQGIEIYRRPIFFDLGDFVDDYAIDPILRNDRGLLFLLAADATGVRRLELVPTLIERHQVNRAKGAERDAIAARIVALADEMGTVVRDAGGRLVIELQGQ